MKNNLVFKPTLDWKLERADRLYFRIYLYRQWIVNCKRNYQYEGG